MLKIIKFLFLVTGFFLLFSFVANNNGTVQINWLGHEIKTTMTVFMISLVVFFYFLHWFFVSLKIISRKLGFYKKIKSKIRKRKGNRGSRRY